MKKCFYQKPCSWSIELTTEQIIANSEIGSTVPTMTQSSNKHEMSNEIWEDSSEEENNNIWN